MMLGSESILSLGQKPRVPIKFICYPALTCWAIYLSSLRDSLRGIFPCQ
jgi:hypothetical protein